MHAIRWVSSIPVIYRHILAKLLNLENKIYVFISFSLAGQKEIHLRGGK